MCRAGPMSTMARVDLLTRVGLSGGRWASMKVGCRLAGVQAAHGRPEQWAAEGRGHSSGRWRKEAVRMARAAAGERGEGAWEAEAAGDRGERARRRLERWPAEGRGHTRGRSDGLRRGEITWRRSGSQVAKGTWEPRV
jgi:hypothetical protein